MLTRWKNGIISGLDWFPTFVAAAGNPNIKEELMKGKRTTRTISTAITSST
jgi:hypothetical protein